MQYTPSALVVIVTHAYKADILKVEASSTQEDCYRVCRKAEEEAAVKSFSVRNISR